MYNNVLFEYVEWAYVFNTQSRRDFGIFYLDFMHAVDPSFLVDPDNPFVLSMVGSRGKSLAADVIFHHVLDHLDPMDIIDGAECRHMYLEAKPKDAIYRPLFDYGQTTLENGLQEDVSLMFVNQPNPEILGCWTPYRTVEDKDTLVSKCLRQVFEEKRKSKGGLIFASGFATFDHSHVTMTMEGGAENNWDTEHFVHVNSSALHQSPFFEKRWQAMIEKYEACSVLNYKFS